MDYRGEIGVIAINLGDHGVNIEHGERIAQLVLAPVAQADWNKVKVLPATSRGDAGFGSTGEK